MKVKKLIPEIYFAIGAEIELSPFDRNGYNLDSPI